MSNPNTTSNPDQDILHERDVPWRRWQMDALAPLRRQATAPPGDAQARETARRQEQRRQAEIDTLREKARQTARDEGHREGVEAGRAEGYAKGLEEGREDARRELDEQLKQTLAPLQPLAEQFQQALARLDEQVAAELVELALATGRQLAGEALKSRPRQVLELVRALLHTEPAMNGKPRLWLHPLDHKLVTQHLSQELEAAGWVLQPDAQIHRGGCRVSGASGERDATWETRWDAVRAQIRRRKPADNDTPSEGESAS